MSKDWGLVLAGGGAKGSYQIGAWRALAETGLDKNVGAVSGASIGSLNAVLFAGGTIDRAEEAWRQVDLLTVYDTDWALLDGVEGTFSREDMLAMAHRFGNLNKVSKGNPDVYCSVSKMKADGTYEGAYMPLLGKSQAEIENILMASSAMPIIYEAVPMYDGLYRDGGLTDNLPVKPLYDAGYRKMIVMQLSMDEKNLQEKYPDVEFLLIKPSHDLGDLFTGTLDFRQKSCEFRRKLGYRDAKRIIDDYLNPGKYSKVMLEHMAMSDYNELMVDARKDDLQASVDEHYDKLKSILGRYGIDEKF